MQTFTAEATGFQKKQPKIMKKPDNLRHISLTLKSRKKLFLHAVQQKGLIWLQRLSGQ
jgi:hypothetical protein